MKTQIKQDMLSAMKAGDTLTRDVLRVLLGEIERNEQGKDSKITLSNDDITAIVKKISTNIKESNGSEAEILILSKYLPQMLSAEQIDKIIDSTMEMYNIDSMKGMGLIMKEFSSTYPNQYDGKLVSEKIREKLN